MKTENYHSCVWKQESCLVPVFPTIYECGSIQFSDTLMSDGYFHIFLTKESNQNVSEISIDPLSEQLAIKHIHRLFILFICENIILANDVKIHVCHVKISRLERDYK